jgi:hypothetical protein
LREETLRCNLIGSSNWITCINVAVRRLLLWLCVGQVPLVSVSWALSLLAVDAASSNLSPLHHSLAASSFLAALYLFLSYCVLNRRTRRMIGARLAVACPCCCAALVGPLVGRDDDEFSTAAGTRPVLGAERGPRAARGRRERITAASAGYGANDDFRLPRGRGFGISTYSTTSRSVQSSTTKGRQILR